ncbi:MAG: bacillithiol biosynthesis deacetylase BshB1 [Candidatus Harrisonbacteria bacterium]|nr:bacillithiol biosynthesis deacetylase BshB1 [Candidatus Harrisonbacteria bacterium]
MEKENIDILAFGPHPDDVEFGCGGLLRKAAKQGKKTGIIDMTQAELSTNGDIVTRRKEAEKSKEILCADIRLNLEIKDGQVLSTKENRDKVIRVIRRYDPSMVLMPYDFCRHPDHENAGKIIKDAIFFSGLEKYKLDDTVPTRPQYLLQYMLWFDFKPSVIFDISKEWDEKIKALFSYQSQFKMAEGQKETADTRESTQRMWAARARHYGFMIGAEYGEPYKSFQPIGLDRPFDLRPNYF